MSRPYTNDPDASEHETSCPMCGGFGKARWCATELLDAVNGADHFLCGLEHKHSTYECPLCSGDGEIIVDSLDPEGLDEMADHEWSAFRAARLAELELEAARCYALSNGASMDEAVALWDSEPDAEMRSGWRECLAAVGLAVELDEIEEAANVYRRLVAGNSGISADVDLTNPT